MDKLYTIQEVATKLNLSDKTLRRWEEAGKFASSRTLGNQRRYSLEDLQILDAIKHGTINSQKDLLSIDQASKLCGVSPTTILRWENESKIYPFITSGNTYYIRTKLVEKLEELKKSYRIEENQATTNIAREAPVEPSQPIQSQSIPAITQPTTSPSQQSQQIVKNPSTNQVLTKLSIPTSLTPKESLPFNIQSAIFNVFVTLILILSYHLLFNSAPTKPISPQTGSVQGVSTTADPTLDLLRTILEPTGALTTTTLTSKLGLISPTLSLSPSSAPVSPTPGMVYYDASSQSLKVYKGTGWAELSPTNSYKVSDATLVTGTATLPKGKNQISVTSEKVTPTTPVTITFSNDYAPAKKYWLTASQGSFTVYTDFPVSQDSPFSYNLMATTTLPVMPSPSPKLATPSATLR